MGLAAYSFPREKSGMENAVMNMSKLSAVLKSLVISYIITALLLLLLAFLLFQLALDEGKVALGIIAVYLLSCFLGGFFAGKKCGSRKFLWGLAVGSIYFFVLLTVSLTAGKGLSAQPGQILTTFLLCAGGGMLGGMVS